MKKLKLRANNIVVCILEVVIGILVLIDPVTFSSGIIIACGIVLMLMGLLSVIKYFRMEVENAVISQQLLKGLILLAIGAFCAFRSHWFITTFPLLTIVYGVVILVAGLIKVQWAVDMLRMRKAKWYLPAISAAVSFLCATVVLKNPFTSTAVLWVFTGVSLIVEAMLDVVALVLDGQKRKSKADLQEVEKEISNNESIENMMQEEKVVSEEKGEEC